MRTASAARYDTVTRVLDVAGVTLDSSGGELLAQVLGVAVVRFDVDRTREEKRFVETVQLVLDGLRGPLRIRKLLANGRVRTFQICSRDSFSSRM